MNEHRSEWEVAQCTIVLGGSAEDPRPVGRVLELVEAGRDGQGARVKVPVEFEATQGDVLRVTFARVGLPDDSAGAARQMMEATMAGFDAEERAVSEALVERYTNLLLRSAARRLSRALGEMVSKRAGS